MIDYKIELESIPILAYLYSCVSTRRVRSDQVVDLLMFNARMILCFKIWRSLLAEIYYSFLFFNSYLLSLLYSGQNMKIALNV